MNEDQDAVDQVPEAEGKETRAGTGPLVEGEDVVTPESQGTEEGVEAEAGVGGVGGVGGTPAVPLEPGPSAIRRLEEQLKDSQDRWLRLAAEFDNFRKRIAKERVELGDRAQAALVMRLLEVLDDLDRLAEQDLSVTGRDVLHEALVLVDRKLRKELAAAGLERIDPVGTPFDPTLHEAVSVQPPPSAEQEHQVSALFQAGYQFKGSLVRPAQVEVYTSDQD